MGTGMGRPASAERSIRQMAVQDTAAVAGVHQRAFPGFFLTSLGGRFLRVFYRACCAFPGSVVLVAETGGAIDGFVVGVVDHEAFHRYMRSRWALWLGLASLPAAARPAILARFARALVSRGPQMPEACGALLMSIAVDPEREGRGVGRALLKAFDDAMGRLGCGQYRLTTDRDGNGRVNRFYRTHGLSLEQAYVTPQGRWMNQYLRALPAAELTRGHGRFAETRALGALGG